MYNFGRVIGRSSSSLILINALDRPDRTQAKIHIPVKDSTFSYEFNAIPKQAFWHIFEDDYTAEEVKNILAQKFNQKYN